MTGTLVLVCGMIAAGKTALARRLARERGAERLSPDEWILRIMPDPLDTHERDALRDPVERLQWVLARQWLAEGRTVILENGFWIAEERISRLSDVQPSGARVELYLLEASADVLHARLAVRNTDLPPGTFAVTAAELDHWIPRLEAPTADELEQYDVVHVIRQQAEMDRHSGGNRVS